MKKLSLKGKWLIFTLANTIPFALYVALYRYSGMLVLYTFPYVFAALTVLNYRFFDKTSHYVFLQALALVCFVLSQYADTTLYYNNISNDSLTPLVGMLMALTGTAIIVITTLITATVKHKKQHK